LKKELPSDNRIVIQISGLCGFRVGFTAFPASNFDGLSANETEVMKYDFD